MALPRRRRRLTEPADSPYTEGPGEGSDLLSSPRAPTGQKKPFAPLARDPRGPRTWSIPETRAQHADVEQLLIQGTSHQAIFTFMRGKHGVGEKRSRSLIDRVTRQWAEESAGSRERNREAAVRRIMRQIQNASGRREVLPNGRPGAWTEPPNHAALARYETILASLQGTYEPVRVEVDVQVSHAILQVISQMSPEEVADGLAQQERLERDAALYRALSAPTEAPSVPRGTLSTANGRG